MSWQCVPIRAAVSGRHYPDPRAHTHKHTDEIRRLKGSPAAPDASAGAGSPSCPLNSIRTHPAQPWLGKFR